VPSQQYLGRDDRGHLGHKLSPQSFDLRGESALLIREPEATAPELLAQHAILLAEVLDHLLLLLIHPSGHGDQDESEGIQNSGHLLV
jgi:hypothetical protein